MPQSSREWLKRAIGAIYVPTEGDLNPAKSGLASSVGYAAMHLLAEVFGASFLHRWSADTDVRLGR